MAGILSRFKTIMEANINALLDKAEDPVKMADQLARDLEKDLGGSEGGNRFRHGRGKTCQTCL